MNMVFKVSATLLLFLCKTHCIVGWCAGQVRCIFSLPKEALKRWFPAGDFAHKHLAFVEWYTPFAKAPIDANSQMYRIKPLLEHSQRKASIVPCSLIRQSLHLYPRFGAVAPAEWKSSNVLALAESFYVNPFIDRFNYSILA